MWRAAVAVLALSLLSGGSATAQQADPLPPLVPVHSLGAGTAQPFPWDARVASAVAYARGRRGRVAFAVVDPAGRVRGRNIHERHSSASVVKAMLLVAYLNYGDVPRRALGASEKALLRPMITRSNNRSATRVRNVVGNAGLVRLARRVRMKDFATARSWGSTQISAYDQARFFWGLDSYVPARHRAYARALLERVVASQRWGIPRALPEGWRLYFKGGWVPPRLVNQAGRLERGDRRVAIAVLSDGDPSFRYGQGTIEGVARRLLARLNDFEV